MADFAQILIRAKDETKGAFDSAARNMRGLEAGASKLRGLMGTIGIGAGLSAAGFAAFAKSSIDAADNLNDMSQRLGVSVKDLASFKLAAEQSGTSLEGVGNGIARLTRSIGEAEGGNKKLSQSLADLGVTARDPKEAFFQLADATERIADPAKRAALLSQVLGKSYQDLIPLLAQGSDELRRSAQASESFADAMARLAPDADKFNDQLAQLKINAAGAAAGLLTEMVPSLNEYLGALQKIVREGSAMEKIGFFTLGFIPAHILDEQATTAEELGQRVASYRQRIAELKDEGKDASAEIATMNRLMEKQVEILNRPPKRPGAGTLDTSAATSKTRGGTKSDPLAGLIGSTDIGRMAEFEKNVALLNQRFSFGRKDAELYTQAMTKLVEQTFANNFKQAADDAEFFRMVEEDGIRTTQEWRQNLEDLANVDIGRLNEMLANTDFARLKSDQEDMILLAKAFTEGIKDADGNLRQLSESEYLDAVRNRLGLVKEATDESANAFRDFGMIMVSSLEEAIVSGGELGDVLDGLEKDLLKMGTRKLVTDPLSKYISNFDFGSLSLPGSDQNLLGSFASLFGFADGGIMTGSGPISLNKYASGGIASSPQLALFGEGSKPEAFVPLPDGRRIPVAMQGGGGSTIVMNISTPDANSFRASQGQITAQYASALQRARRNM